MSSEVNLFNNSSAILTGKEGCECIDASSVLASLVDKSCQTPDGENGVKARTDAVHCVPYAYGSNSCLQHDLETDPACQKTSLDSKIPDYCHETWCYVDKSCARLSDERVARSVYFPGVYYSYTTCESADTDWSFGAPGETLKGATILAAVPGYWEPFHYKRDANSDMKDILSAPGLEYYNDSIPFEGATLNYLENLVGIADGDFEIQYTHVSRYARKLHPGSWYTAAVQDVKDGLVDIGVAPFWVTGERLQMTPFTVPIGYDRTYLVIPEPGTKVTLKDQVYKVVEPFTMDAWITLLCIITMTAFLGTWFAEHSTKGKKGRKRLYARWFLDSFLEAGTNFCSHGVREDEKASLPTKLLIFGFSFFILIALSAYVANLAAFLTRSIVGQDATMEAVIASGKRICALPALKDDLRARWDRAKFIFNWSGEGLNGLLKDYDEGKCDVVAIGDVDLLSNIQLSNDLCKRNLVATTSLIIENALAFPVNPSLSAGLSYWMYKGEKYNGESHHEAVTRYNAFYNRIATCDVQLNSASDDASELARISVENLFFPIVFFAGFAFIAIALQSYHQWSQRNKPQARHFVGRLSTIRSVRLTQEAAKVAMAHATQREHSHTDEKQSSNDSYSQNGDEEYCKFQQFLNSEENSSRSSPAPKGSTGNDKVEDEAYSKFQQLVDTGAMDDFISCFQAMKDKAE